VEIKRKKMEKVDQLTEKQIEHLRQVANLFTYNTVFDEPVLSGGGVKAILEAYERMLSDMEFRDLPIHNKDCYCDKCIA
jgi:hypothetical protein